MLPCTSFFSDKLNFKTERVTPKEGKATTLPFTSFFSSKLGTPKEEPLTPTEKKAVTLPFAGCFSDLVAPPEEKPQGRYLPAGVAIAPSQRSNTATPGVCGTDGTDGTSPGPQGRLLPAD